MRQLWQRKLMQEAYLNEHIQKEKQTQENAYEWLISGAMSTK